MAERKLGLKAKATMGVAALTLFFAQIACGGTPKIDPCDEAFQVLTSEFTGTKPGVVGDGVINVWPADPSGKPTHPRIPEWMEERDVSWREVVSYMRFNCSDRYDIISLSPNQDEGFYDNGVIVRRKPVQNFSLPEQGLNWVNGVLVAAAAILSISALLGRKKLVAV